MGFVAVGGAGDDGGESWCGQEIEVEEEDCGERVAGCDCLHFGSVLTRDYTSKEMMNEDEGGG